MAVMSQKILPGDQIGHLTVQQQLRRDASGRPSYITKCVCGATRTFSHRRLVSGKTTHCGCQKTTMAERQRERVMVLLKELGESTSTALTGHLGGVTAMGLRPTLVALRKEGRVLSSPSHEGHVWSLAPAIILQPTAKLAAEHYDWAEQVRTDKRLRDIMRSRV